MKKLVFIVFINLFFIACQGDISTPSQKLSVTKKVCINNEGYSTNQIKEKLLKEAKNSAIEEIFGSIISSTLKLSNGKITKNQIIQKSHGFVRIKGQPIFYNGNAFGESCVKIDAYITKKDYDLYSFNEVKLNHHCYNNPNLAVKLIKQKALESAYIELLRLKKPSINLDIQTSKKLLHDVKIVNTNFDMSSGVYCFDISAKVSLLEVDEYSQNNRNYRTYPNKYYNKDKQSYLASRKRETKKNITSRTEQVIKKYDVDIDDEIDNVIDDEIDDKEKNNIFDEILN